MTATIDPASLDRPRMCLRCRLCGKRALFAWHSASDARDALNTGATVTVLVPEEHECRETS